MKTTFLPHGRPAHANALYRRATLKLKLRYFPSNSRPIVFTFAVFPHLIFTKGASHMTAASLIKAL